MNNNSPTSIQKQVKTENKSFSFIPNQEIVNNPLKFFKELNWHDHEVLRLLISMINRYNQVYPRQEWIGSKLGISRILVNRSIARLTALGCIRKTYRTNDTCLYYLSEWFTRPTTRQLLKNIFKSLAFIPLYLIVSIQGERRNNYDNSLIDKKKGITHILYSSPFIYKSSSHETAHTSATASQDLDSASPETACAYGAAAPLWEYHAGLRCAPTDYALYDAILREEDKNNELMMQSLKEAMMQNPIKQSVMDVTKLLNLNRVGQIKLMQFEDQAIKHATKRLKLKGKVERPWEYFFSVANYYNKDHNIESNQAIVDFLLDTYGLSIDMKPIGISKGLEPFEGEALKSSQVGKPSSKQQAQTLKSAIVQPSVAISETEEARNLLENYLYDENVRKAIMPEHFKNLLAKAEQWVADGTITLRPLELWIEAIKPSPGCPGDYATKMRGWLERKNRIMDKKVIVTYEDGNEIKTRFIRDINDSGNTTRPSRENVQHESIIDIVRNASTQGTPTGRLWNHYEELEEVDEYGNVLNVDF